MEVRIKEFTGKKIGNEPRRNEVHEGRIEEGREEDM
jgi:hypothetical protein